MSKGTKRASPGDDKMKNILDEVELGNEDAKKLHAIQRDTARIELAIEREGQTKLIPVLQKRREVLRSIPGFWPVALMKHSLLSFHLQHNADKSALSYLEDVWVEKDPQELRCFKLEFVSLISLNIRLTVD